MKKTIPFFAFFFSLCVLFSTENILNENNHKTLENEDETEENEEDFSFSFEEDDSEKDAFSVSIGGGLYIGIFPFFDDFKNISEVHLSSLVWAKLRLNATAPLSQAFISVNLNDQTLPFNLGNKTIGSRKMSSPRWIDEAFLQIAVSSFYLSGGIKKISWGKADSFSILDVVNPKDKSIFGESLDYAKMGVPLFQFVAYMPQDIKLECVFLPIFESNVFAIEGRWAPHSLSIINTKTNIDTTADLLSLFNKDTAKLGYSHGGLRLTSTIAQAHDVGFQYFYGYSKEPIIIKNGTLFSIDYLPLHNIGFDYATAIDTVNLRSEFCTNIIRYSNLKNSNFEWNLSVDAGLPHGFSVNLLAKQTIWFSSIKNNSEEALKYAFFRKPSQTDTLFLFSLSQTILRGALEWKLSFLSRFEDVSFAIVPSIYAIFGTIILDAKVGVFLGKDDKGFYSQYKKNNFFKLSLGYEF